jgi:hypothetical protein
MALVFELRIADCGLRILRHSAGSLIRIPHSEFRFGQKLGVGGR